MTIAELPQILQPVPVEAALAAYYGRLGGTRFWFDGPISAAETFDRRSFLPLIANIAESRSRQLFKRGLDVRFVECGDAVLGYEAIFPEGRTDFLQAMLMVSAAENLFGPPSDRQIDLVPVWKYWTATPEERLSMALPDYSQEEASGV